MGRLCGSRLDGSSWLFSQLGINYDETFSPVVKQMTIQVVLSIVASHSWPIRQLDVKNAFLHGTLDEMVFCEQPSGFIVVSHPQHVYHL